MASTATAQPSSGGKSDFQAVLETIGTLGNTGLQIYGANVVAKRATKAAPQVVPWIVGGIGAVVVLGGLLIVMKMK